MPEMEPMEHMEQEHEDDFVEVEQETEDEDVIAKNEQNTRSFFAVLSFLIAVIFLAIFFNMSLNTITGLVVLFGTILFGMGGFLLLERKPAQKRTAGTSMNGPDVGDSTSKATVVDSTLVDGEDEDDSTENEDDAEDDELVIEEDELSSFEMLVEDALSSIPFEFQEQMANLAVLVEREPDEEVLQRVGVKEGYTLLGLYQGVPLTSQGYARAILPERITIYQRTIEDYCHHNPDRIRMQVRHTVLHEVAHHFGMDHDEMPIWVK